MRPLDTVSQQHLASAFASLQQHAPDTVCTTPTLERALLDKHVSTLVRLHAWLISRGTDPYRGRHTSTHTTASRTPHPYPIQTLRKPAGRDFKRAAAADLDD